MTDRPAPASLDTEKSVLGAILLDEKSLDTVEDVSTEHFFLDAHKRIFRAMIDMREENTPIDIFTLADTLRSRDELTKIGGMAFLSTLTDGVPAHKNLSHYGKMLADKKQRRELLMLAHNAMRTAYEPSEDVGQALETIQRQAQKIVSERTDNRDNLFVPAYEFVKIGNREVEWRIERVIEKGTNGIIQALPKTGKSLAVCYLACCLVTGIPWFDLDVSRCRTALVSREDFAGTTARRIRRLFLGMGLDPERNAYAHDLYVNSKAQSKTLALDNPRELASLIKNLQTRKIEFVIFDVFNVLHNGTNENDAAEMTALMSRFKQVAAETGAQVCIIHHKKKNLGEATSLTEAGRGSSAIGGFAEFIIDFHMVDEEKEIRQAKFETKAGAKYKSFYWNAIDTPEGALKLERTQFETSKKRAAKAV